MSAGEGVERLNGFRCHNCKTVFWTAADAAPYRCHCRCSSFSAVHPSADDPALTANQGAGEWRDIASAPRDGTRIDLWVDERRIANAFWRDGRWLVYSHSVRCVPRYHVLSEAQPTHWLPLPASPTPPVRGGE